MTTSLTRQSRNHTPAVQPDPPVEVHGQAVRYSYSCLPPGHIDRAAFTLTVRERRDGRWSVVDPGGFLVLSDIGQWEYELPSGQSPPALLPVQHCEDWLEHHRFDLPTAQALAIRHAPRIRVNGQTATDVLNGSDRRA